jgi:dCTP deaminase
MIALGCGQIEIDPQPDTSSFSSTAVDLTLAEEAAEWTSTPGLPVRPGDPGYNYHLVASKLQRRVDLTSRIAARVEGKSSLARLGLGIHVTAPTIHVGFRGQFQLEMFNAGPQTIILDAGMKICQLIFEQTSGTPEKGYSGVFAGQKALLPTPN